MFQTTKQQYTRMLPGNSFSLQSSACSRHVTSGTSTGIFYRHLPIPATPAEHLGIGWHFESLFGTGSKIPIGSMYAIYGNIYHQYTPNVSIYTIHGSYGIFKAF